jgi:hypothetical protein
LIIEKSNYPIEYLQNSAKRATYGSQTLLNRPSSPKYVTSRIFEVFLISLEFSSALTTPQLESSIGIGGQKSITSGNIIGGGKPKPNSSTVLSTSEEVSIGRREYYTNSYARNVDSNPSKFGATTSAKYYAAANEDLEKNFDGITIRGEGKLPISDPREIPRVRRDPRG